MPPEEHNLAASTIKLDREPDWIRAWRGTIDEDVKLHQEVVEGGYPNRWGPGGPSR